MIARRNFAFGAGTPWKRIRCKRGRGTRAARRCRNSSGDMTIWVVPSLNALYLVEQFKLMEEIALLLYEQRRRRGNLDFDLPEAEIILDIEGAPEDIVRAERNIAHRIIEEFMIAANEAVARHLRDQLLMAALGAAQAEKPMREDSACEKGIELGFDKLR
jgi:exoribonuclease R